MHQCLENPPPEEGTSALDVTTAGEEACAPVPEAEAGISRDSDAPGAGVASKGRVLLLEDDAALAEVITDILEEAGYTVVAVRNGGEGVREVLAADFSIVFCDFMMPGLPGDMFYRAVEKIRPALCHGFIFMTGNRDDARTSEFIKSVNGFVLRKPFPLKDLLDSVYLAEVRRTVQSVFDAPPSNPAVVEGEARAADAAPGSAPGTPGEAEIPRLFSAAPARAPQGPLRPPERALPAVEQPEGNGRSIFRSLLWAVSLLALAAIPMGRNFDLRAQVAASSAELRFCETQWTMTAAQLEAAEGTRSGSQAAVQRRKHLAKEYRAPGMAEALRSVTTAAGANVELRGLQIREETDAPGAFHLRISGVCTGAKPRATADWFRETLKGNLREFISGEGVTTRFESLEDAAPSSPEFVGARQAKAVFTVIATTDAARPQGLERSGKQ